MNPSAPLNLKNATDSGKSWKNFRQAWEVYEVASGTVDKPDFVRLATFLHVAGSDGLEKYNGFMFNNEEDKRNLSVVLEKFEKDCQSSTNILTERCKFYARKQSLHETYDHYVTDLRKLSSSCEFSNPDEALRDQFSLNIKDKRAKERLMVEAQGNHRLLTFDKAISLVKGYEALHLDDKIKEQQLDEPMEVMKATGVQAGTNRQLFNKTKQCQYCGRTHSYGKCPAFGKMCNKCNKKNHFAAMCKTRLPSVRNIDEEELSASEDIADAEECI